MKNDTSSATHSMQNLQSPRTSIQSTGAGQSSAVHQNEGNNALHIAGAVVENGLKTLKGFAGFVPIAPGLGPALGIVCGCIEVYHVSNLTVSVQKEQVADKLTQPKMINH